MGSSLEEYRAVITPETTVIQEYSMGTNNNHSIEKLDFISIKPSYSVREIAQLLRISPTTLYREINSRRLKSFRLNRRRFISGWALIDWLKELEGRNEDNLEEQPK